MKTIPHPRLLSASVRAFELKGSYEKAFELLSPIWPDREKDPILEGLGEFDRAEMLLRCGSLTGFLGRTQKTLEFQEKSKNLLTRARDIFINLDIETKIIEAENGIALAYMRKGEYAEAESWIETSFSRDLSPANFDRLFSFIVKSLILIESSEHAKAVGFLREVEPFFQSYDDDFLNGCFSTNLGIALAYTDRIPEAIHLYSLARHFHQRSGNRGYLATVENNLANIYTLQGRYSVAHQCVDNAIRLQKELGDISRYGFSIDTKANIFLEEGKYAEALAACDQALEILGDLEFTDFRIETLLTRIKILGAQGNCAEAALTYSEAVNCALETSGEKKVDSMSKIFESAVSGKSFSGINRILEERIVPGEELELELSPSLSGFAAFDAVWIRNKHLESVGLRIGSLALIVDEKPSRGDVVAIVENGSSEVICGFYDSDFGIIAIATDDPEPSFYKESEIEILGRIAGYAIPEERTRGKLKVHSIPRVREQ